ncbi:plasminogen receptor (KT)-like [Montipora capricornis]|uniref:plasminogen receptor (KT)-like n=1 Tax=Montipora capricornis TaxID=246305 RepID=UPI0035F13979
MGAILGSAMKETMEENLKKSQEFMLETQKMQLGRQLQMQNAMRERQMSMQLAGAREMFYWLASFYGIATVGMLVGFKRSKSPAALVPFLPLTFIVAYQADYVYGTKMNRIRDEAENIMKEERSFLELPCGMPNFQSIEEARLNTENRRS